jgi:hypothetical protein
MSLSAVTSGDLVQLRYAAPYVEPTGLKTIDLIGPGFWNIRSTFHIKLGLVNIGTQMSIVRLADGNFLVFDTIPLPEPLRTEFDLLTKKGSLIEAVIMTHPFHILYLKEFYTVYPNTTYFSTPRHKRKFPEIPWAEDVMNCDTQKRWFPEVEMRIPEGCEFANPVPENSNHFSSCFVFHGPSKTLHVNDTIMYSNDPGILLRLGGFKKDSMSFHPSLKGPGLHPNSEAPYKFRDSIAGMIRDWDFENLCAGHFHNKLGGAKAQLEQTLLLAEPVFSKLSQRKFKDKDDEAPAEVKFNIEADECG